MYVCMFVCLYVCTQAEEALSLTSTNFTEVHGVLNSTLASNTDEDLQIWYEVAAILAILFAILTMVCLCLWRRCIARAIAIVKECTKVFRAIPLLMVPPRVETRRGARFGAASGGRAAAPRGLQGCWGCPPRAGEAGRALRRGHGASQAHHATACEGRP